MDHLLFLSTTTYDHYYPTPIHCGRCTQLDIHLAITPAITDLTYNGISPFSCHNSADCGHVPACSTCCSCYPHLLFCSVHFPLLLPLLFNIYMATTPHFIPRTCMPKTFLFPTIGVCPRTGLQLHFTHLFLLATYTAHHLTYCTLFYLQDFHTCVFIYHCIFHYIYIHLPPTLQFDIYPAFPLCLHILPLPLPAT